MPCVGGGDAFCAVLIGKKEVSGGGEGQGQGGMGENPWWWWW